MIPLNDSGCAAAPSSFRAWASGIAPSSTEPGAFPFNLCLPLAAVLVAVEKKKCAIRARRPRYANESAAAIGGTSSRCPRARARVTACMANRSWASIFVGGQPQSCSSKEQEKSNRLSRATRRCLYGVFLLAQIYINSSIKPSQNVILSNEATHMDRPHRKCNLVDGQGGGLGGICFGGKTPSMSRWSK